MEIKELIEQQDQEAAARDALLDSLPQHVQAALNQLPEAGRHYLLGHVQDLKAPNKGLSRTLRSGMFLGAINYAFTLRQLDNAGHQCLFEFEHTLTAAPA